MPMVTRGPVPLYYQIYGDLLRRIDAGEWGVGDQLPSEEQLAREYGVSKLTIRQAMSGLVRRGLVERQQGKGTFVTRPKLASLILDGYYLLMEDTVRRGQKPSIHTLSFQTEPAGPVAPYLQVDPRAPIFCIERLQYADESPVLITTSFLPTELYPGLTLADLEDAIPLELIQQRYGIRLALERKWVRPVVLADAHAELLETPPGTPAFQVDIVVHGSHGSPVEYRRVIVKGDQCFYYAEVGEGRSAQRFTFFGPEATEYWTRIAAQEQRLPNQEKSVGVF
jgi:GntR family transcriptional regulator